VYYNQSMKNITITLDDETATWARVRAAQQNKSLSRFLGELLNSTMHESQAYDDAMQRYLANQPSLLNEGNPTYPARHDLYD
jgi:hypothetical protein